MSLEIRESEGNIIKLKIICECGNEREFEIKKLDTDLNNYKQKITIFTDYDPRLMFKCECGKIASI